MENNYYCPKCSGNLNIGGYIVLTAKSEDEKGSIMFFQKDLGDYKVLKHPDSLIRTGNHFEFFCPVCSENLSSGNENLAEVLMKDSDGDVYKILFSEIMGEKATYKIKGSDVQPFGSDSRKYVNYFGIEPGY